MKKAFSIIKNLINIFIVICVLLFLLMVCLQRFTNHEISFFNYRMFTVATGSMAPEYEVGDVLISKETPPEKIKVGDSITYKGQQGTFAGKIVTHSVTRIEKDKNGEYIFHTKGIANLIEDPPVYEKQVYGIIVWKPVLMSIIYKIINTKYGILIFVILPIFYIVGSEMLNSLLEQEEKRRSKMHKEKEEEKTTENKSDDKVEKEEQEVKVIDETNEDNNDNKETIINAEEIKEEENKEEKEEVKEENNKETKQEENNKKEINKNTNKKQKESTEEKKGQEENNIKNTDKKPSSVKKKNNKKKQNSNK